MMGFVGVYSPKITKPKAKNCFSIILHKFVYRTALADGFVQNGHG